MDEETLVTNGLKPSKKTRKSNIEKGDSSTYKYVDINSTNIINVKLYFSNKYSLLAKSKVSFISSPAKRIASSGEGEEHIGLQRNIHQYVKNISKIYHRYVRNI